MRSRKFPFEEGHHRGQCRVDNGIPGAIKTENSLKESEKLFESVQTSCGGDAVAHVS
jgi:hypothetical protein